MGGEDHLARHAEHGFAKSDAFLAHAVANGFEHREAAVLARTEIERIDPSPLSIMPEGQLDPLAPEDVRDLFAYLAAIQPAPSSVGRSRPVTTMWLPRWLTKSMP